ncbi:hypothetical protein I553_1712 [Mycobacterium xenopi 4042]|uniref:Uncharacterized protein n=1 Tax=Mycobacterium xenopi 4042 TaxID=1299334 RepID=X7ZBE8_MYCXE|nr:hypothetical protein I553_1712 [Mycobacterium xenopi 4042]
MPALSGPTTPSERPEPTAIQCRQRSSSGDHRLAKVGHLSGSGSGELRTSSGADGIIAMAPSTHQN